ncbi:MAG: hypothetical protein ACYC9J_08100 [Sulfuricaulis sp.]
MKSDRRYGNTSYLWLLILLASIAGGAAEIFWVALYSFFTPLEGMTVAREVTASLFPALAGGTSGAWLGILIHMVLAVMLGYAFAFVIWLPFARGRGIVATLTVSALTLATVWTINFFVVLPVLNPTFITLMPYPVTFASKMLFALSMALALSNAEIRSLIGRQKDTARITG